MYIILMEIPVGWGLFCVPKLEIRGRGGLRELSYLHGGVWILC